MNSKIHHKNCTTINAYIIYDFAIDCVIKINAKCLHCKEQHAQEPVVANYNNNGT